MPFLCQLPGVVTAEGDNEVILIRMGKDMLQRSGLPSIWREWKKLYLSRSASAGVKTIGREILKLKIKIMLRLYVDHKLRGRSLFSCWNKAVSSIVRLATLQSYGRSLEVLQAFLRKTDSFPADVAACILRSYESEVFKTLHLESGQSLIEEDLSVLVQNKHLIYEELKVPTGLVRSPLLGDFVHNYTKGFEEGL
jgi:hypothetical protein